MSGFYSIQPRIWRGEKLHRASETSQPDPYAPSSPDYGKRTRETATQLAPGMTLVSLGEPIKRLAGAPQPVTMSKPAAPAVSRPEPVAPVPEPVVSRKAWRERDWRADCGLSRGT
jgi:hypothetical protein